MMQGLIAMDDSGSLSASSPEHFDEYVASQFRLADTDMDGVVCRDEFLLYYWKSIIFMFPPVKGIESANRLYEAFVGFCSQGSVAREEAMGFVKWGRFCRFTKLSGPKCSAGACDIAFKTVIGRRVKDHGAATTKNEMDYGQFLEALGVVGEKRREGLSDVIQRVLETPGLPRPPVSRMDFLRFAEDDYEDLDVPVPRILLGPKEKLGEGDQAGGGEGEGGAGDRGATHLRSSVMGMGYRGKTSMRGAAFLSKDSLVEKIYDVFKLYAVGDDASLMTLEWMELQMLMRDGGLVGPGLSIAQVQRYFSQFKNKHDHSMHFHQFMECLKAVAAKLRLSLNEVSETLVFKLYPKAVDSIARATRRAQASGGAPA